jgi:twitching motility protein PilT
VSSGNPPLFRKDGDIVKLGDATPLSAGAARDLLLTITPPEARTHFETHRDVDFAHEASGLARFRCNLFVDRRGPGGVFRVIPTKIPTAEELGLSRQVLELCHLKKGLIVVTGPTGSGKSTTLAAMIDYVNRNVNGHLITIEDPIEFVHENRRCLINQREVGQHTRDYKAALRAALREDPDFVLVGEMRDLETVAIAIETAETGHLVFGTLHTSTAASAVDRIIDQFPPDRQTQVRTMLSESLRGVVAQVLCRKKGGGRVAAREVLIVNSAISNLIREGKTFQIASIMQASKGLGMVGLNESLLDLVQRGLVEPEEACDKATAKTELKALLARAGHKTERAGAA